MLTDVRVYVLGDYLDVPALKQLALDRCIHIMRTHFQPTHFADAITEALTNTKHDDILLRTAILRNCCAKHEIIKEDTDLFRVLMEHEATAFTLGTEMQQAHKKASERNSELFLQKIGLSQQLELNKKDLERIHESVAQAVKLANKKSQCRNESCKKEFGATFETWANGTIRDIRCKRCRCKHYLD